jgi:hypothetical protein
MIPCRVLHRLASALCSPAMNERVIDALVADCQHEWLEAGSSSRRLLVLVRSWVSLWIALAACLVRDVRHDIAGFTTRIIVPFTWASFWVTVFFIIVAGRAWVRTGTVDEAELWRNVTLISAYLPALAIASYRNKRCRQRSWFGLAWSVGLMAAFLAGREFFSEYRFILGWAAGSCVAASWTFLVKKHPVDGPA